MARITVEVLLADDDLRESLAQEVRAGLSAAAKSIPPTWFYDEEGSRLFDEITRLPEYYLTRAERALLERHAAEIASLSKADTLVELGAGSASKSRVLLDALSAGPGLRSYVPFDVSETYLLEGAQALAREYPNIQIHCVVADFRRQLGAIASLPGAHDTSGRLVAFLGGTIGNLTPTGRTAFLVALRGAVAPGDHILIGTDLEKDPSRMIAAYDDREGVTARFNRNVLSVVNRELRGDFDPAAFAHVALWNPSEHWIEMRLRSSIPQTAHLRALELDVELGSGEDILTEVSTKFTAPGFTSELAHAGFSVVDAWGEQQGDFLLTLARPED